MKLETFFNKFDQFADAPDAVAKMRELVLELAVRGRLISSGKPNPVASSDPSAPFPIPDHWRWSTLSEAADCRASAKVSPSSIADTAWVLDLEDIEGTTGRIIQFATFAERRSLSTKAAFEPGGVLYGKLRPLLEQGRHRCEARILHHRDHPGSACLVPFAEVSPVLPSLADVPALRSPKELRHEDASTRNEGFGVDRDSPPTAPPISLRLSLRRPSSGWTSTIRSSLPLCFCAH